jgi:hypothetical protein
MRLYVFFIFIFFSQVIFSQVYFEGDSCCLSRFRGKDFDKVEIYELAKDFKKLSAQENLCCDVWNSDLHQIMIWLEKKFGKEGTKISQIIKYMGMPNGTDVELLNVGIELEGDEKALMYFWRGYHDFLYFVYEDNKVKYAEWYLMGE